MSNSPKYKVFRANGEYVASCKYVEDAAKLMEEVGDEIRVGHSRKGLVWAEGADGVASESYDAVAEVAHRRERERHEAFYAKTYGKLPS